MTASKNDFHFWQRPSFNLLSQAQLDHIYAAALEVLARVGGEFHDPAAVALLSDAGARVDADRRVRIPDTLVADALQKAPRQIVVHDRNGQPRLFLEDRNTYFGPGSDTPYTLDPVSGVRRLAVLNDVVRAARVVDALPELWIDEETVPVPRTIYHRTKLRAESSLEAVALQTTLPVTVIRMSRCFPEPAPVMAAYRLHRGVDARDVADAHALAATEPSTGFRRYVVSGSTPFLPEDRDQLLKNASEVIEMRCPELAAAFRRRKWKLPGSIDRVYSPSRAANELHWRARYGFEEVLAQLDRRSLEVLPPRLHASQPEGAESAC